MYSQTYRYANIVVTGGIGFIGMEVSHYLKELGYKNVQSTWRNKHELTNFNQVHHMFDEFKPDCIINCAGVSGGPDKHAENPFRMYRENLIIGVNLISRANQSKRDIKFIQLGTSASYPDSATQPLNENSLQTAPLTGVMAPYGNSRLAILDMLRASKLDWAYLVPSNVIGRRNKDGVVKATIDKVNKQLSIYNPIVEVWGDGLAIRDFVDVRDVCKAIHLSMESQNDLKQPINIGSGRETSIKELVNIITNKLNYKGDINFDASKPSGKPKYVLDNSLAKTLLGWEPQYTLEESLDEILK